MYRTTGVNFRPIHDEFTVFAKVSFGSFYVEWFHNCRHMVMSALVKPENELYGGYEYIAFVYSSKSH